MALGLLFVGLLFTVALIAVTVYGIKQILTSPLESWRYIGGLTGNKVLFVSITVFLTHIVSQERGIFYDPSLIPSILASMFFASIPCGFILLLKIGAKYDTDEDGNLVEKEKHNS